MRSRIDNALRENQGWLGGLRREKRQVSRGYQDRAGNVPSWEKLMKGKA